MPVAARCVLVLVLTGLLAAPPVSAAPPPEIVNVPQGIPVRMDGWPNPSEWSDAATLDMGAGATLRVKQVRGMLLLAFDAGRPWPNGARLLAYLAPGPAAKGMLTQGTLSLDYEPRDHARPHLMVRREATPARERLDERVVARFQSSRTGSSVEIAIPGDLLPASPRLALQWSAPGRTGIARFPKTLNLRATSTGPPPGLATGASWARLDGVDGKGPGAYPASTWKQLIADAAEIDRVGDELHSYVLLLLEEWMMSKKEDARAEKDFFERLRWLAAREPLTSRDLMAKGHVLHFLNRRGEALGVFETVAELDPAVASACAKPRARILTSMHRFEDAAEVWMSIAERKGIPADVARSYAGIAEATRETGAKWAAEQKLRRAAEARPDQPLVALTTRHGTAVLLLHRDRAKAPVDHFLAVVKAGQYDGTCFHRVHGDARAQGGTAASKAHGCHFDGSQASATPPFRTMPAATNGPHQFFRGAVALVWQPDQTHNSEFLIVTGAHPEWSKDRHVIIGHVLSGQDVVDRIEQCDAIESLRVLR